MSLLECVECDCPDCVQQREEEVCPPVYIPTTKKKKKEEVMYTTLNITSVPIEQKYDALGYIENRLYDIFYEHVGELQKKYHMTDLKPRTIKELKEALAGGKYYFTNSKHFDDDEDCYAWGFFHLGQEPDKDGYKTAKDKLDKAYNAVKDQVKIKTDEDYRLKVLQEFEAATFQ